MTNRRGLTTDYRSTMFCGITIVAAILMVVGCEPDPSRQAERLISNVVSPRVVRVKSVKWCASGADGERVGRFQVKIGDPGHGVIDTSYLVRFRGGNAVSGVLLDSDDGVAERLAYATCA